MRQLRTLRPELRPFVDALWQTDSTEPQTKSTRVRALPTGAMHVAFRLYDNPPIKIFADVSDAQGFDGGYAVVNGFRSEHYIRSTTRKCQSVGVMLKLEALPKLFRCHADELAHRHKRLDDIWTGVDLIVERLSESTPETRLETLQQILVERLCPSEEIRPAIKFAVGEINRGRKSIRDIVRQTGYSHRRFNELFRRTVGVNPKTFSGIQRFQQLLVQLADSSEPLSVLAIRAGYSDQAHMTREFRRYAGISPGQYLRQERRDPFTVTV